MQFTSFCFCQNSGMYDDNKDTIFLTTSSCNLSNQSPVHTSALNGYLLQHADPYDMVSTPESGMMDWSSFAVWADVGSVTTYISHFSISSSTFGWRMFLNCLRRKSGLLWLLSCRLSHLWFPQLGPPNSGYFRPLLGGSNVKWTRPRITNSTR